MVADLHDRQCFTLFQRHKSTGRTCGREEEEEEEESHLTEDVMEKEGLPSRETGADARAGFMRVKYKFAVAAPSGQ